MAQRLPRLTADEIIRVLRRYGFDMISQRGMPPVVFATRIPASKS